jgi:transcriptional regulator with XRE-family HTH domain
MSHTVELLDRYKKAAGLKSDNAAALTLGVTRSSVSAWRHGKNRPEPETVEAMARAAGLSAAKWVPLIEAERAKTQEARATWLRIAGTAASVLLVLGGLLHQSATAQVQPSHDKAQTIHMRKSARGRTDSGKRVRHVLAGVLGTSARRGSGICAGPAY